MKKFLLALLALLLIVTACSSDDVGSSASDAASAKNNDDDNETVAGDDDADAGGSNSVPTGDRECAPIQPVAWPAADFEDPAEVAFDDNLFFTVDGQRFFPIGFYNVPQTSEALDTFKEEGFNLALSGPGCCGSGTQPQIDWLQLAQEKEIFIIMHPWSNANDVLTRPEEELAAELDERNGVGSLFGWYTFDEPALHRPSKELTGRMHEVLATYSSDHPDCLVEQAMDNFSLYMDDCGFFMIDPYPVPFLFTAMVKAAMLEANAATEGQKPVVGVMQAFSWNWYDGNYDMAFRPDANEVRNMAWQFIVLGARGLIPWNYGGAYSIRAVPEIWESYLNDVAEMNELMRVLLTDEADTDLNIEATFPTMIDYIVKQEETATWILSVSTNERPMKVSYDLSTFGTDLCVVDYSTGEVFIQDENGRVDVKYDPLQVRIIEILD